jgi:clan AA aspartic protease (TIGR02281 family)
MMARILNNPVLVGLVPAVLLYAPILAGAAAAQTRSTPATLTESLTRFEALYDRYLKSDPRQAAIDSLQTGIASFNEDLEAANQAQASGRAAIDGKAQSMKTVQAEVAALEAQIKVQPSATDAAAAKAHNEKVARYNQRAEEYRKLVVEHNERVRVFNEESASRKAALDARKAGIEAERARVDVLVKDHNRWFETMQDLEMGKATKAFFADVMQGERKSPADPAWNVLLPRARALRRKLAEYAIGREKENDAGVVIVEAQVGDETCWFVLDTGASRVSVSPELASALGLESSSGEEIVNQVAGGMKARGRGLVLSRVRVGDAVATDVPAVELPEGMIGVDGLLGRSFLGRFELTIGCGRDPQVTLKPVR